MKKLYIGLGVLAVIVAILIATGALKFDVSVRPSSSEKEFVLPKDWVNYKSGEFGYSVAHPDGWNLQESNNGSRDLLILAPGGKAFVRIAGFKDSSLNSIEDVEKSMADYKAGFASKPNEQLKEFKSEIKNDLGIFGAAGFMSINDIVYQFLERGIISPNGRVLIMRGAVETTETAMTNEEFENFVATVKQIMNSFSVQ